MPTIQELLDEVTARTQWGNDNYYQPFQPENSRLLRAHYGEQLPKELLRNGCANTLRNKNKITISHGYTRIVIGDYGAFIEISPKEIFLPNIVSKWPGEPTRPVKYLWMQTKDSLKTKVYWQKNTVRYADYKPDMYYVDPVDVVLVE